MTIATGLFVGLLLHLLGDYVTQNSYVANTKTERSSVAMLHATIYGLPFLLVVGMSWQLAVIVFSHAIIDRFRIITYWIKLTNWNWSSTNFGFSAETPKFMSVWLMIIADNTFHLIINSAMIYLALR